MTLPPRWKVKRELRRLVEKTRVATFQQFADRFRQFSYDRNLSRLLRETSGDLPLTPRIAVFVLFQPRGIAGSTFLTLDHLAQEGWSVVIVSNARLSDADRARLARRSAHVIERPNTGYDFGAYREGWRWLDQHVHKPDRLILMNDSTWFPLRMQDDSLRRMEALGVDLAGHIFKTEDAENKSRDHMEAHLLMLGPRALAHPAISGFWADYRMSNSRSITIRKGEKGITQTARATGLSVQGLLDRERMVGLLSQLPDADLLDVVRDLVLHTDDGRQQRADWLTAATAGQPWRDGFLSWASHELANSQEHLLSVTFIDPAIRLGGMGFLKKSQERRFQLARMALLRGIGSGRIPPIDPIVTEEVQAAIRAWKPPVDWRTDPNKKQTAEL